MRRTYRGAIVAIATLLLGSSAIFSYTIKSQVTAGTIPVIFRKNKQKPARGTVMKPGKQTQANSGSTHAAPASAKAGTVLSKSTSMAAPRSVDCTANKPSHARLAGAQAPTLRKLAEYETVCGGIANGSSFFAPTPRTAAEGQDYAYDTVLRLKESTLFGITPIIFLEPTYPGGILDFNAYKSGAFDAGLDAYFAAIKSQGISDTEMGRWVLFPEGNIPVWGNIDAAAYAANVTKTAQYIKKYFPSAHVSIMLDSMTYPNGTDWSGGQYRSLLPYVQSIPRGLLNSFGLQGFPWTPPANEAGPALFDPAAYLRISLAAEAARTLGVGDIWLNTGSMSVAYAGSSARKVTISPSTRQAMLDGAVHQATALKLQGFKVSIHLFAEDKSRVSEGINWAYWPTGQPGTGDYTAVFKAFAHDIQASGIDLWIFDTY